MKKLLVLCLAVLLMASMAIPAFAVISPEADVITTTTGGVPDETPDEGDKNDSSTSPQTGSALVLLAAGVAVTGLVGAGATAKKLSDKD